MIPIILTDDDPSAKKAKCLILVFANLEKTFFLATNKKVAIHIKCKTQSLKTNLRRHFVTQTVIVGQTNVTLHKKGVIITRK